MSSCSPDPGTLARSSFEIAGGASERGRPGAFWTATSLGFASHNILRHREVLERLHHERAHVIGAGPVAPAQVGKLDYLDAVVKETLQLNPIVSDGRRVLASLMRRCVLPSVGRTERSPLRIDRVGDGGAGATPLPPPRRPHPGAP